MVSRDLRLRTEHDVRLARSRGRAFTDGPLVVRVYRNALEPAQNRYTVIASKKVGKSHERNRCKRLVREAIRSLHPQLRPGHDVVVVLRGGVSELTGLPVAMAAMERIVLRAGLLLPDPTSPPGAST